MLGEFGPVMLYVLELAFKVALSAVIVLRQRGRSAATIAWIAVVLAQPIIGLVAYLLVGEVRLGRTRIARHRQIVQQIQAHLTRPELRSLQIHVPPEISAQYRSIATLAEVVGQEPPRGGNDLRLFGDADLFIQSLVEDIDAATSHCHLLFYIFLADHSGIRIGQALMRAASRGVACRVLVDAVGSNLFLKSDLRRHMAEQGVHIVAALPANLLRMVFSRVDLRNHRKIALIDGRIGYTGSQNIADAEFAIKTKYAPWVDTSVRIVGPVAHDLQTLFVEDWFLDTDESLEEVLAIAPSAQDTGVAAQVMGTGPNSHNEALQQLIQASMHTARKELILTTPYFVPDDATLSAICTAAYRGVDTSLVVPARNDSPLVAAACCSNYDQLLRSGVAIHEYTKGLLHAKTMTIDRELALISTANLDRRSFDLNFEASLLVYDSDFAGQLRFMQRAYMADSVQIDAQSWTRRGWTARLAQNAAGLLGPLL